MSKPPLFLPPVPVGELRHPLGVEQRLWLFRPKGPWLRAVYMCVQGLCHTRSHSAVIPWSGG